MKKEISPLVVIGAIVVIIGFVGYFGWRAVSPAQPPAGSYTPGVPPWLDKSSANYGKPTGAPVPPGTSSPRG
ncbi:hypothetical protein CCAX7_44040 [Capsulimonas corticalis]|uniref:Uncharacterized protein n=1 Tax=Capsulimonas corticalis TaxID=2219043 RepID=A0A402CXB0_9BACT|nr:hypothetical protein [Capsulimonas corticalis]BDI32353.1 hypothetical protein CCAX7_44040 [Capsulimonas corticalis]